MRKRLLKETNGIRLKTVKRDQWHIMNAFDTMAWPYVPVCQVLLLSLESSLEGNNKSWCVCVQKEQQREPGQKHSTISLNMLYHELV